MATTSRTRELAGEFEAATGELIEVITACNDAQWNLSAANDERSVGVLAHHVAETNGAFAHIVRTLANGETFSPSISMEEVHDLNAQQARDNAKVGKQETLDRLRANSDAILAALGTIDDDFLDRPAGVFGDNELTVNQVIEWIVIGHTAEHLQTIRAAIGG
ncbi:MAG TPA: DinB family protein [Thermomicrobiales bacterium]|nr:DinB family protein [Thermomicrobiales bacterium]